MPQGCKFFSNVILRVCIAVEKQNYKSGIDKIKSECFDTLFRSTIVGIMLQQRCIFKNSPSAPISAKEVNHLVYIVCRKIADVVPANVSGCFTVNGKLVLCEF